MCREPALLLLLGLAPQAVQVALVPPPRRRVPATPLRLVPHSHHSHSILTAVSVSAEPPRQLDVEGVEVDVADPLEELVGPGLGQGLGQSVAPRLVFSLQGAQLLDGRGPPLGTGAASADDRDGRELADGLAGREAGPVSSLALGAALRVPTRSVRKYTPRAQLKPLGAPEPASGARETGGVGETGAVLSGTNARSG